MGQTGSKTNKSSSKSKHNAITPKGNQSKTTRKENEIIEKNEFLNDLDPNKPDGRRKQYISPAARQDLDRIFMD